VNDTVLTLSLAAVAAYFSVLILRDLRRYLRFRRVRQTALVTWPGRRPIQLWPLLMLGVVNAIVAVAITLLEHPFHKVYSQLSMAFYFLAIPPLLASIPMGFYGDGIWSEGRFLPYANIRRLAFREGPDLVLLLLPRDGGRAWRLTVPPAEYGAVRRILGDKIRAHVLNLEGGILGL
jgi:hypothetical protein